MMDKEEVDKVLIELEDTSLIYKDQITGNYRLQNFFTKCVEYKMLDNIRTKIKFNCMLISYYHDVLLKAKEDHSKGLIT